MPNTYREAFASRATSGAHNYPVPEAPSVAPQPSTPDAVSDVTGARSAPALTEQGALEHSPNFRAAARASWQDTGNGERPNTEAGFTARNNGDIIDSGVNKIDSGGEAEGKLNQVVNKNTAMAVHTHPIKSDQKPSPADKAAAKSTGRPFGVITQGGLDEITPGTGQVEHVFDGQDWMKADPMPHKVVQYSKKDLRASNKVK